MLPLFDSKSEMVMTRAGAAGQWHGWPALSVKFAPVQVAMLGASVHVQLYLLLHGPAHLRKGMAAQAAAERGR